MRLSTWMRPTAWLGLAALAMLGGCDEESGTPDSGTVEDSGSGTDAGGTADAGGTDAGTTDAGMTDAGGATDAGTDAGPEVDAGPATCEMGRIRIEEACSGFTACGGDLVGSWCYSEICVTKDELLGPALMNELIPEGCDGDDITIVTSSGTVTGTVDFAEPGAAAPGKVTRTLASSAMGTFIVANECVLFGSCAATGGAVNGALGDMGDASCTNRPGSSPLECDCDVTFTTSVEMADEDYVADETGGTFTIDGTRTFDYCVDGDGIRMRETTEGDFREPGLHTALPL